MESSVNPIINPASSNQDVDDLEDTKPRRVVHAVSSPASPETEQTVPVSIEAPTLVMAAKPTETASQTSQEEASPSAAQPAAQVAQASAPVQAQQAGPAPTNARKPAPTQSAAPGKASGSLTWLLLPVAGVLALGLVALVSAFGGYSSGIGLRRSAERTQVAAAIAEQYQLGLQDVAEGQYYRARQRFEYVINADPNYPGAAEKLAEVLLELNTTATPTLVPTPTLTPTPDTRGVEDLYNQSSQALTNSDWSQAIETLLALRKNDPAYRTVEVDGMLFLALRNRGRDKILKEADLEGGIYDLTLANKFGVLDAEAQGLLNWTTLYITGASFWGIDWEQAVYYFQQVAPQTPNLMDGSKMTASERLRIALFELGNQYANAGQHCRALQNYQQSLAIAPDPKVQQAAELVIPGCEGGGGADTTETPKPGKKPKKTPSP